MCFEFARASRSRYSTGRVASLSQMNTATAECSSRLYRAVVAVIRKVVGRGQCMQLIVWACRSGAAAAALGPFSPPVPRRSAPASRSASPHLWANVLHVRRMARVALHASRAVSH